MASRVRGSSSPGCRAATRRWPLRLAAFRCRPPLAFIQPDRAGVAYGGFGEPDGLDLQQGQIVLGIGTDNDGWSPEFTRSDHDDAASIGHHVMGGQNIPIRMDDHAASGRFFHRPAGAFGCTQNAGHQ